MAILHLLKNYDPLILLLPTFKVLRDDYRLIELPGCPDDLGIVYNATQSQPGYRSSSIGDIIQTGDGLFIILGVGFKKVNWGDELSLLK